MSRLILSLALVLTLAACQSAEERAEEHYQAALALLAEGDMARATIEFRNVFQLNGLHVEARRTYAQALRTEGNIDQSFSQFLRLVEQVPDDVVGHLELSELAIETQSWAQLQTHGTRLLELVPEAMREGDQGLRIEIVAATLAYAQAIEAEDDPARRAAADRAQALLTERPEALGLHRVLVDNALRDQAPVAALGFVDRALTVAPDNRDLHNTRLALLAEAEDAAGLRAQLETMIDRFPGDADLIATLLRFYLSQNDTGSAEAFLRARIDATEDAVLSRQLRGTLVQFLLTTQGAEAALAEVEAQIAATGGDMSMQMMQATIRFAAGDREGAITQMSDMLAAVGEDAELAQVNDASVLLAGMYLQTGNPVGARRLVSEVLATDPSHGQALRLEAGWLIDDDRADDAIALLRRALDEAPDDTEAMTLMASAHSRNGNHDLARDFLALAHSASNAAPAETLRYAAALIEEERYLPAEEALITALRLQPGNLELLQQLGRVYLLMEDWGRAEGVEDAARRQGTEEGMALASSLRVARLTARGQTEDALGYLQELADDNQGQIGLAAQIGVIATLLGEGDAAAAQSALDNALAENPENVTLLLVQGAVERAAGDIAAAIETYRGITEMAPDFERAWIELIRAEFAAGETEAARATLDRALGALPQGANLLWAQASFLESSGDVEGAIAIYERLYEEMPDSPVVANNLASLISTYRADEESLERAYAVARRLRGTDVPQMMDTYGWIALRRGEIEEARPYLEGAAAALADDPLVQFHYGMLLSAAQDREAAIAQLDRALTLAGEDPRPQFDTARMELDRLRTGAGTDEGADEGADEGNGTTGQ